MCALNFLSEKFTSNLRKEDSLEIHSLRNPFGAMSTFKPLHNNLICLTLEKYGEELVRKLSGDICHSPQNLKVCLYVYI